MTLGLTMIVKNEEEVLARALSNASVYADEIVIVDTGSTDGTVAVAKAFTDKVYSFTWCDDFAAARNFAFSKTACEYRMWLDADDVVPDKTAKQIATLKRRLSSDVNIVMLPYVLETDERGVPVFSYYRERIVKNVPELCWHGRVHEVIPLVGKVIRAPYSVRHMKPIGRSSGGRNLGIYERMIARGEPLNARERYYYARELFYNGEFERALVEFDRSVLDPACYIPNRVDACIMESRCLVKLGRRAEAFAPLFKSFEFALPTGEACCEIALLYFADGKYERAAFWFETAARIKPDYDSGAFVDADCYGFLPFVWLTVCYDRLGDLKNAYKWHCRAKKAKPSHPSVVANQKYFDSVILGKHDHAPRKSTAADF